jgi:protein-S-isoprenylcysteine O-methyltransferase Ste14
MLWVAANKAKVPKFPNGLEMRLQDDYITGMSPELTASLLWIAWLLSWVAAALWSARTLQRPALGERIGNRIVLWAGIIMLFGTFSRTYPRAISLWKTGENWKWLCDAAILSGFAFCWWARLHLGKFWSAGITRKEGHMVVDSGPYALVRHPIYTGVLTAAFATAAMQGSLIAFAGAALMTVAFYWKARMEETFLRAELGVAAYDAYAGRVAMLVPFVRF